MAGNSRDQTGAKAIYMQLGGSDPIGTAVPPGSPGSGSGGGGLPPTVIDTTTARIAAATDSNTIIEFTNAYDITYTIKPYSAVPLPVGSILYALQGNTGKVTFVPFAGVTFESPDSYTTRKQESIIAMKHVELDRWEAMGDLEQVIAGWSVLGNSEATDGPIAPITSDAVGQVLINDADDGVIFRQLTNADIDGLETASPIASGTVGGVVALTRGMAVCLVSGLLRRATSASPYNKCIGFLYEDSLAVGNTGRIQTAGLFTTTTAMWDNATGMVGGLSPHQTYYLTSTGAITPTAPTAAGSYVAPIGVALDSTTLRIELNSQILL